MKKRKLTLLTLIIILPILIVVLLQSRDIRERAASSSIEIEHGVLSGNISIGNDNNASNGQYVLFGQGSNLTQTPTNPQPTSQITTLPTTPQGSANTTVNFTSTVRNIPFVAIAMDISGYGQGSHITNDQTHRQKLVNLKLGMMRMEFLYENGAIVCGGDGCAKNISGDAWISSIKAAGAEPIIITPLDGRRSVDQDKTDAVNLVKHFNQQTNNPVKRWIIGNELDNSGNPDRMDATTYANRFNAIYDAMKAVDPSIKIGGPATAYYNTGFIETFLTISGNRVDFIDFHTYGQGGSENKSESTLLNETLRYTEYLTDLRTKIDAKTGSRAGQIEMQVGEWNLDWNSDPKQFTHFNTIWSASALGRILQAGGHALMYADKNGALGALFETNTNGGVKNDLMPIYHGYGMFTGENLFPRFGTSLVAANTTLSNVEVYASNNPKNIVAINKNQSQPQQVSFALTGVTSGTATVWQKDPSIDTKALPQNKGTIVITNGRFVYTLPGYSVVTFVVQ